jgi:hypothetical protein
MRQVELSTKPLVTRENIFNYEDREKKNGIVEFGSRAGIVHILADKE